MLERLARALPGARFEDAQALLRAVRSAKSGAEVAALRDAHEKAARAAAAAGAALRPGGRTADLEAAAYEQMALDGIGFPLAEIGLWVPGSATPTTASRPTEPFTIGARLVVDVLVSDGGVCGRAVRSFVCGRSPTAEEEDLGRAWRAAAGEIARVLRPGCAAEQLREAVWGVAQPGGDAAVVELLVHGLGIGIEPPFLRLAWSGSRQAIARGRRPGAIGQSPAAADVRWMGVPGGGPSALQAGADAEARGGAGARGPTERDVLLVAPTVALRGAGEMSASETLVVTPDGGRALGASWRPWSAS
jgi:hypothetical protein